MNACLNHTAWLYTGILTRPWCCGLFQNVFCLQILLSGSVVLPRPSLQAVNHNKPQERLTWKPKVREQRYSLSKTASWTTGMFWTTLWPQPGRKMCCTKWGAQVKGSVPCGSPHTPFSAHAAKFCFCLSKQSRTVQICHKQHWMYFLHCECVLVQPESPPGEARSVC